MKTALSIQPPLRAVRLALAAVCLVVAGVPTVAAQDGTMPLSPRQNLIKGRKYVAADGLHHLVFQPDGNLVVYDSARKKVWGLDAVVPNIKAQKVQVGEDGNLIATGPNNQFLWSALSENPDPRAWIDLTPSGVLQLVSDRRGILWASDGQQLGRRPRNAPATCVPYERLAQCVPLAQPRMKIMATKAVSPSAIALVKQIYSDMAASLTTAYPWNKLDGVIVYMTNGEPWPQLRGIGPIGPDLGANNTGDEIRGGATKDYLWITEQMICKTGVKTRGAKDTVTRTVDQVVHEFAHTIEANYGFHERAKVAFPELKPDGEAFAWAVQRWYQAPVTAVAPFSVGQEAFMRRIFVVSPKTYSCAGYTPGQ
jgi:hypothetical protein